MILSKGTVLPPGFFSKACQDGVTENRKKPTAKLVENHGNMGVKELHGDILVSYFTVNVTGTLLDDVNSPNTRHNNHTQ